MPTNKEIFNTKMNALANAINTKAGTTGAKDLDALKTAVDGIVVPSGNINITDTNQTNVAAYATAQVVDANLIPANIADGVTVLGITGTHSGGAAKPSYLISDGDTVTTFYFNKEYALASWCALLTGWVTDPISGLDVVQIGLGYLFAVDLTDGDYALVWNDGNTIVPIWASTAVPAYGVTTAGWQVGSYTPDSSVTVDMSDIIQAFQTIMDSVVAQDDIAFGDHGSAKAHTFAIPTITGTYTYTGSSQTPTITGYYSDFMTKSGNTSATSAGSYSITVSLSDTTNCQWSDGTTSDKTVSWSIAKAALPKPTLSAGALTLNDTTPSGTFTVSRSGNGAITATSSNPTKISASVSGTTVTVTALDTSADASADIVITVAEGTNYLAYTATDVKCVATIAETPVNALFIKTTASNVGVQITARPAGTGKTMTINYGDGDSYTFTTAYGVQPSFPTHTYTSPGSYRVTFDCNDDWYPGRGSMGGNIIGRGESSNPQVQAGLSVEKFVCVDSITQLYQYAFDSVTTLTEVTVPNSITKIGERCFHNCTALTSIELGDSITEFGSWAFESSGLTSLTIKATTPPTLGTYALRNVPATCAIYVPAASVEAYKAASGWSARAAYIQAIPTT